ncbi:PucR family transcriptional regulator [Streptomyces sp. JNUCC 64]
MADAFASDDAAVDDGLAKIVTGMLERVDDLGDSLAELIDSAAGEHRLPLEDLHASCRAELRNVLRALAGEAPLYTTIGASTGRRLAQKDMPEAVVVTGYRMGFRHIWELLIAEAEATGLVDDKGLVAAASSIWRFQDIMIESAVSGYRAAATARIRTAAQEHSALLDALLTNRSLDLGMLQATLDVLRMPRYGWFAVLVAELPSAGPPALARTEEALRRSGFHSVWHLQTDAQVGIIQLGRPGQLEELAELLEGAVTRRAGLSPVYEDLYLTGAHRWYARAAMQSRGAGGRSVTVFDDHLVAVAAAAVPEIGQRLAGHVFGPLDELPQAERKVLIDALETWIDCGGSVEETAKRMYCHPNTVRLRLRRIRKHTGRSPADPKDVAELCLALYALRQKPAATDPARRGTALAASLHRGR